MGYNNYMEQELKFEKYISKRVTFVIAIVGIVMGVVGWVRDPQKALQDDYNALQDRVVVLETQLESNETVTVALQKIKDNDLHELHLSIGRLEERDITILQALARVEALLKK